MSTPIPTIPPTPPVINGKLPDMYGLPNMRNKLGNFTRKNR